MMEDDYGGTSEWRWCITAFWQLISLALAFCLFTILCLRHCLSFSPLLSCHLFLLLLLLSPPHLPATHPLLLYTSPLALHALPCLSHARLPFIFPFLPSTIVPAFLTVPLLCLDSCPATLLSVPCLPLTSLFYPLCCFACHCLPSSSFLLFTYLLLSPSSCLPLPGLLSCHTLPPFPTSSDLIFLPIL